MNWFLIALLAPALWSVTNYIDKYLISKYFSSAGPGALLIFSSLIGFLVFPIIFIIHPDVFAIQKSHALLIALNGVLFLAYLFPYLYALQKDDASNVVPLFQTAPIFSYILGYAFLGESLSQTEMLAASVLLAGAVILSLEFSARKIRFKTNVLGLMLLSSFLFALNSLIFKFVAVNSNFWITYFWGYVGWSIAGVLLFGFFKKYRLEFLSVFRKSRKSVVSLNILNEIISIVAGMCFNFATLLAPLALVTAVNGFQPFFILLYGIILTVFFPKVVKEDISRKTLIHKLLAITLMFIGGYLLNM